MAVRFISYPDTTGYGLAALAYLRGLVNRGVPVQWRPARRRRAALEFWSTDTDQQALEIVRASKGDPSLRDLRALMGLTLAPKECEAVVAHVVPEHLPACLEEGKRNFAYCAWESDTLPAHWPDILNRFDAVLVPSTFNAEVFCAGGVRVPVHAVPHMRRHAIEDITPGQRAELRTTLGIDTGRFVFYSIGAWMPRKDHPRLIEAFLEEFRADEPVTLVLKTSGQAVNGAPVHEQDKKPVQLVSEIADATARRLGRPAAQVVALQGDGMSGVLLDCLHQIGDAYVSLTHGEGWGMGAFEAALLGKPVLMTGWSGQLDFLGADHPGLIGYTLEHIDWPGTSYLPHHRWAVADVADARRKMRAAFEARGKPDSNAQRLSERITNRFSEAQVMVAYCRALGLSTEALVPGESHLS